MDIVKKHVCNTEIIEVKAGQKSLHEKENLIVLFTVKEPEKDKEYRLIRFTRKDAAYSAIQTKRRYGWTTAAQTETDREPVLWEQFWEMKAECKETSPENAVFMNYLYIRNIFGSFTEIYKQDTDLRETVKKCIASSEERKARNNHGN